MGLDVASQPLGVLDPRDMWGPLRAQRTPPMQSATYGTAYACRMAVQWQPDTVARILRSKPPFTTWSAMDGRAVYGDLAIDISRRYFDGITLALLRLPGEYVSHK